MNLRGSLGANKEMVASDCELSQAIVTTDRSDADANYLGASPYDAKVIYGCESCMDTN